MATIKTLPIVERWECAGCARCCRGSLIWLNEEDQRKLREQAWERHTDFTNTTTVIRNGWFSRRRRLAQRKDGTCVFLLPDGRCRIHAEFGADAKPLVCRMFPLQLVPRKGHFLLTTRRACPTAAADKGPEIKEYVREARGLAEAAQLLNIPTSPPALARRKQGTWDDFLVVAGSLERLVSNPTFPLVRRLAHGLRFCSLLEASQLRNFDTNRLRELCTILEDMSLDVGELFQQRTEPSWPARVLFRLAIAEYLRLHPAYVTHAPWRERWRKTHHAIAMVRGRGIVPGAATGLPESTFDALDRPLGHQEEAVQHPMLQFFMAQSASAQYAIASRPGWSLVESFRALALAYPVGLWFLRWIATNEPPSQQHAIDIVTMLDRGQGFGPLTSTLHRACIRTFAGFGELERLVAWYAR